MLTPTVARKDDCGDAGEAGGQHEAEGPNGQAIPFGHRHIPYFAAMSGLFLSRLVRTWLVIATVDGLFASALSVFAYKSTVTRLWQGVAATVLGPSAFTGGLRTACVACRRSRCGGACNSSGTSRSSRCRSSR
jgi:hypothetical protein